MGWLQILGMAVLLLVLAVLGLLWWAKLKFKQALFLAKDEESFPVRLSPKLGQLKWQQSGTDVLVLQMKALGFVSAGRYSVAEMPDLQLWAGVHPDDHSIAVVYDHRQRPPWFDVFVLDIHHNGYGVTTTLVHDPRFVSPDSIVVERAGISPKDAQTMQRAMVPKHPVLPLTPASGFPEALVQMYAKQVGAAISGPLPDREAVNAEATRACKALGINMPPMNDKQWDVVVTLERSKWQEAIAEVVLDRYAARNDLSAAQRQSLGAQATVVHQHLADGDVLALALKGGALQADSPEVQAAMHAPGKPIEKFDRLQALLTDPQRLRLLGEVALPLLGRVYVSKTPDAT